MKTICWNHTLQIRAENDQDAWWLTGFVRDLPHRNMYGGIMDITIGEFDDDGKLMMWGDEPIEYFKDEGGYIFFETDSKDHSGQEGQVVELEIRGWDDWFDTYYIKAFKKEFKKQLICQKTH